jgi:hypothetical protein
VILENEAYVIAPAGIRRVNPGGDITRAVKPWKALLLQPVTDEAAASLEIDTGG